MAQTAFTQSWSAEITSGTHELIPRLYYMATRAAYGPQAVESVDGVNQTLNPSGGKMTWTEIPDIVDWSLTYNVGRYPYGTGQITVHGDVPDYLGNNGGRPLNLKWQIVEISSGAVVDEMNQLFLATRPRKRYISDTVTETVIEVSTVDQRGDSLVINRAAGSSTTKIVAKMAKSNPFSYEFHKVAWPGYDGDGPGDYDPLGNIWSIPDDLYPEVFDNVSVAGAGDLVVPERFKLWDFIYQFFTMVDTARANFLKPCMDPDNLAPTRFYGTTGVKFRSILTVKKAARKSATQWDVADLLAAPPDRGTNIADWASVLTVRWAWQEAGVSKTEERSFYATNYKGGLRKELALDLTNQPPAAGTVAQLVRLLDAKFAAKNAWSFELAPCCPWIEPGHRIIAEPYILRPGLGNPEYVQAVTLRPTGTTLEINASF